MDKINKITREYSTTSLGGKTIYRHRKIWIENKGEIPEGFIIHHINRNKKDNTIENLKCVSKKEHGKLHSKNSK